MHTRNENEFSRDDGTDAYGWFEAGDIDTWWVAVTITT